MVEPVTDSEIVVQSLTDGALLLEVGQAAAHAAEIARELIDAGRGPEVLIAMVRAGVTLEDMVWAVEVVEAEHHPWAKQGGFRRRLRRLGSFLVRSGRVHPS